MHCLVKAILLKNLHEPNVANDLPVLYNISKFVLGKELHKLWAFVPILQIAIVCIYIMHVNFDIEK